MPIFSKNSLETLRQKIDLVEVLSSHIDLKRAGAAYKALCPFHDEKTPSFTLQKGDSPLPLLRLRGAWRRHSVSDEPPKNDLRRCCRNAGREIPGPLGNPREKP